MKLNFLQTVQFISIIQNTLLVAKNLGIDKTYTIKNDNLQIRTFLFYKNLHIFRQTC